METLITVLIFLAVLFVLILVHEWGHFFAAKRTGMRVDEFGIGFPPKLMGIKKGETEYTINALPIGGFVRIFGEDMYGAKESSDYERSFIAKPKWAQAIVLLAGVTMNIIFAWLIFAVAFMWGVPDVVSEAEASPGAELMVVSVLPDSPAATALPPQAVITEVRTDTESLADYTPTAFREFVGSAGDTPLTIEYEVGGESAETTITPTTNLLPEEPERSVVGVSLALVDTISVGPGQAIVDATNMTVGTLQAIVVGLSSLIANSFTGTADYSQVAGPVGIAGLVGDAAAFGFTSLLMFTALISLNLAVINLLPFPALDGGRLLFVLIETVTRKQIDPIWALRLNGFGMLLLLALMVAVTYNDIIKLL